MVSFTVRKSLLFGFQCGNYGIGGHYGTHPDFYDYDESAFHKPESKINRISTVMTILEGPEAGNEHIIQGCVIFPVRPTI